MRMIDEEGNVSGCNVTISDLFEMLKSSPIPNTGGFLVPQCMHGDIFRCFTLGFFDCVKRISVIRQAYDNTESDSMRAIWLDKITNLEEVKRKYSALTIYKDK